MKTLRSMFRYRLLALGMAVTMAAPALPAYGYAQAQPAPEAVGVAPEAAPMIVAQGDCYAIGQQVAAQNGGTLARASQSDQGGRPVCVIVVLVPGKEGKRPRRVEFIVPAN